MLHQHRDSKGAVFGYPHPMEFNHKRTTTQCKHLRTQEETIKRRCPECGIGKKGVDSLCDSCYREYLGTHVGARSED